MGNRYDVVVVGGGHNGVIAAAVLARHGFKVALVERNRWLGGLASGLSSGLPKSFFAYALGLVPEEINSYLGLVPSSMVHEPDPSWVVLEDGEITFRWWRDGVRLREEAVEAGIGGLPDLLDLVDRFWSCFKEEGLYYTPSPPTVEEASSSVDSCDSDAAILLEKKVDSILSMYLPVEWWDLVAYPTILGANGFSLAYYLQGGGLWTQPLGGMASFSRRLRWIAEYSGVDLILGVEAEGILLEGGMAKGVSIEGGSILEASRGVIYSGPIYSLLNLEGSDRLEEREIKELEAMRKFRIPITRVDYIVRRKPNPPRDDGWRGYPIISYWTKQGGGDYTYPTLYTPDAETHIVQASGYFEDPHKPLPPGVDERDIVFVWPRGPGDQASCCLNETGHPDHIPLIDPYILDGRPLKGWGNYTTGIPRLYHASASSYPGGEVNGVAGVNAALRILADNGVKPRIPIASARKEPRTGR